MCFQQKKDERVPLRNLQIGNFCYIISSTVSHYQPFIILSFSVSVCLSLITPSSEFKRNLFTENAMILSAVLFHTWHRYFVSSNKRSYTGNSIGISLPKNAIPSDFPCFCRSGFTKVTLTLLETNRTARRGTARQAISQQSSQLTDRERFVHERAFRLPVVWWWHPSRQEPSGAVSRFCLQVSCLSLQRPERNSCWICGIQSDVIVNSVVGECQSIPPVCEVYPLL